MGARGAGGAAQAKNHANSRHPKQAGKYIINDLLEAMSLTEPELLLALINNDVYNSVMDILLGFSTIGAFTTHWIEPGADRQTSHVDYPMHVGSGKFWQASVKKVEQLTTRHQVNHMLPFFSVQALMASDKMDVSNGSTEVVPFSHGLKDVDMKVHNPQFYEKIEPMFVNMTLEQGDVFMFNRRLCHRGGKNLSAKRRNSAIMQCVWMWGTGQHDFLSGSGDTILANLAKSPSFQAMAASEKERFSLRLRQPYPLDTTKST